MRTRTLLALPFVVSCARGESSKGHGISVNAVEDTGAASAVQMLNLPEKPKTFVRDEVTLEIDGTRERWTLEWTAQPELSCVGDDFPTCACSGFAYAESGTLELVRRKIGTPYEERLRVFSEPTGQLMRWAPTASELSTGKPAPLPEIVQRPIVRVLKLADLDRDGRATEFSLQTKVNGCGDVETAVFGITPQNPRIHRLRTDKDAGRPR